MTTLITIAFALALGYIVTVACYLTLTFGITSAAPTFVATGGRISRQYILVLATVWTLCATAGGYMAALLTGPLKPWLIELLLTAILAGVLAKNVERRKRQAIAQQIAMTALSALGVAAGFWLRLKG